ncbi:MAG: phospho-N-acetylmuramoyl-pentapeptide-transferase, partial [Anaerolineae bacterium]|nr:phospho-N-acetylmuramoyl-pentapeptide-transferase [Anaerolineae bacterium]
MSESTLAITLSMLSFMLAVIWGGPLVRVLKHFRIGKVVRMEGP